MGFGKQGTGAILREDLTITLGALAGKTGIFVTGGGLQGTLGEDFRIMKTEIHGVSVGIEAQDDIVELYLLNGELSLAEAEACIESNGPTDRNDRVNTELAERWVRYVGHFADKSGAAGNRVLEGEGRPVVIKPGWTFSDPEGWEWMAYNAGGANMTTGGVLSLKATHYGVWVT